MVLQPAWSQRGGGPGRVCRAPQTLALPETQHHLRAAENLCCEGLAGPLAGLLASWNGWIKGEIWCAAVFLISELRCNMTALVHVLHRFPLTRLGASSG